MSEEELVTLQELQYAIKNIGSFDLGDFNHETIISVLNLIEKRQKELLIVDKYADYLWAILEDYDGYYDEETKQGSLEGLASLVDEAIDTCKKIMNRDTKSIIYTGANGKKYNILMEEVGDGEN